MTCVELVEAWSPTWLIQIASFTWVEWLLQAFSTI